MTHLKQSIKRQRTEIRRVALEVKTTRDIDILEKEVSMLRSLFRAEESEK